MLEFLLPPFMMCVVLGVIHVYMGMHVLRREVIFVDLALAQMAALGATVAQSLEGHAGGHGHAHVGLDLNVMMSFGFAALGALIFALTGRLKAYISQEAMVGIVYAVAAAAMMLVLSKAPDGVTEERKAHELFVQRHGPGGDLMAIPASPPPLQNEGVATSGPPGLEEVPGRLPPDLDQSAP